MHPTSSFSTPPAFYPYFLFLHSHTVLPPPGHFFYTFPLYFFLFPHRPLSTIKHLYRRPTSPFHFRLSRRSHDPSSYSFPHSCTLSLSTTPVPSKYPSWLLSSFYSLRTLYRRLHVPLFLPLCPSSHSRIIPSSLQLRRRNAKERVA